MSDNYVVGDPVLDMYVRLSLFVHIESKHNPSQKVVMLLSDSTVCVCLLYSDGSDGLLSR